MHYECVMDPAVPMCEVHAAFFPIAFYNFMLILSMMYVVRL